MSAEPGSPNAGSRHGSTTPAVQPTPALREKPSLIVLPFQNMSGDLEQEYFADGVVEEITTAIARFPWLLVIARNSAFAYKGKAVDVRQVAREFRGALCARRLCAQGRQPGAHHRATRAARIFSGKLRDAATFPMTAVGALPSVAPVSARVS